MNTDKVKDIVENTFTKTDLSIVIKQNGLTWSSQLKAVLNLIPSVGGALAQEFQNWQDYRDSEFFRKYTIWNFLIQRRNSAASLLRKLV